MELKDKFKPEKRKSKQNLNNNDNKKRKLGRIIIRNISFKASEDLIHKHFSQFGKIVDINLLTRPDGKLVGCCFIQYERTNDAAKAILKSTNKEFLGRPIYADWAIGKDTFIKKQMVQKNEKPTEENDNVLSEIKIEKNLVENSEEDNENLDLISNNEEDEQVNDESSSNFSSEDEKAKIKLESPKKQKNISNDVKDGCTIFFKNIPFDATSKDLKKICIAFGPIYYALINNDPISGHSKGTGFVKFKTIDSANLCLNAGDTLQIFDQILEPHPALSRDEVQNKKSSKQTENTDKRNLYLAKEGLIMAGSKSAEGVSASDMAKRHNLEKMKTQILKNLNRFVSRKRLSIHNLPLSYDDEKLRNMILERTKLKCHECRVMREKKPTIEFPNGKSKGFGFMSFATHEQALSALRKLNNNPNIFGINKRPIVAFSIEDKCVEKLRKKRLQKSLENNPTNQEKMQRKASKDDNKMKPKQQKDMKASKKSTVIEQKSDEFVGTSAMPGKYVKMRSNRKIQEQAVEHFKKVKKLKKIEKRKKGKILRKIELKEIQKQKLGRKKLKPDNLEHFITDYKKIIDTNSKPKIHGKKKSKWYS